MKPVILFRAGLAEENELDIAKKYFRVVQSRMDVKPDELVIARYSALPYYEELEKDINSIGAELVNSYKQHQYVSDLANWYLDLEELTPKTWFAPSDIPHDLQGSFVLKGATNSRKQLWKSHMFAATRANVMDVYVKLLDDSLIQHQGIYIREFAKFKNYGLDDVTGAPITKEFRCFFYKEKLLAKGFYWSQHYDTINPKPEDDIPEEFLEEIALRVDCGINFWVVDVAQSEDGKWMVVELNDGQMSGLSCIGAEDLYKNLKEALNDTAT